MIHLPSTSKSLPVMRYWSLAGLLVVGSLLISVGMRSQRPMLFNDLLSAQTDGVPEQKRVEPAKVSVTLRVDTFRKTSTNLSALNTTLSEMSAWHESLPLPGDLPKTKTEMATAFPAWFVWGRMGGAQADAVAPLPRELEPNALRFYAAQSPEGVAVCLANHSKQKISVKTIFRLPRGVYKAEVLSFRLSEGETPTRTARLEGLSGRDITKTADTLSTLWTLEPGEAAFVRATNEERLARLAFNEANVLLKAFAHTRPSQAQRLKTMLSEAAPYLTGIRGGTPRSTLGKRLNCVHRILLYTAQAQSLHGNYMAKGVPDAATAAQLMGAFERVTDSLAETSAVILGLVPRIAVTFAPAVTSQLTTTQNAAPAKPAQKAIVTLSLTHQGSQTLRDVKLGVDARNLPSGMTCLPAFPDYFALLKPGQSLSASFTVQGVELETIPLNRFVGDISYFTVGAPAHLRPRPW